MQEEKIVSRKLAVKEVEASLSQIESLKQLLGKKRFNKRIKKATKLLTASLPKEVKIKKEKLSNSLDTVPMLPPVQNDATEASVVNE